MFSFKSSVATRRTARITDYIKWLRNKTSMSIDAASRSMRMAVGKYSRLSNDSVPVLPAFHCLPRTSHAAEVKQTEIRRQLICFGSHTAGKPIKKRSILTHHGARSLGRLFTLTVMPAFAFGLHHLNILLGSRPHIPTCLYTILKTSQSWSHPLT